jgi:hypothetical protein
MTAQDFLAQVEAHLQLHATPFSRAELMAWVQSTWPLIADDPCPEKWCDAFLDAAPLAEPHH